MRKYVIMISIFLLGLIIGALAMDFITIPARKAYREYLQTTYVHQQDALATAALKQRQRLRALVHLWNEMEAISFTDSLPETGGGLLWIS
jgi:hypothetical protein